MMVAVFLLAVPQVVEAGQAYDSNAFVAAQEAGKSILVDVTAPWCPTCAKQKPTVQGLEMSQPKLVVFDVDFDSAKDVLKQLRVTSQSTLIMFKGKAEMGRSTGETDPAAIAALVGKGL
ncbi:thioredoxin [Paramagnetospirillum kuznetsovii]|uniref:Thioredoxin n=2 Tax=Paramagnetospirillum kuznetsovii TaxID=2053833 RepID=A0A364P3H4_9PROT|nr:thioredoxin [Paramagnetospirillum kuznetsovii]